MAQLDVAEGRGLMFPLQRKCERPTRETQLDWDRARLDSLSLIPRGRSPFEWTNRLSLEITAHLEHQSTCQHSEASFLRCPRGILDSGPSAFRVVHDELQCAMDSECP